MSDPDAPQHEKPRDVDDVVGSANAGLDAAAAAGADVPGNTGDRPEAVHHDPDLAAFEEAERSHPGTFAPPTPIAPPARTDDSADADRSAGDRDRSSDDADTTAFARTSAADEYRAPARHHHEDSAMANAAYAAPSSDSATRILPSEPLVAAAAPAPQPIFVQAPEPPRERGNRGTAAAIGLLATLVFAVLYLGATIGLGALAGDVTGENIGEALVAPLLTWGFWTPVVVFFLGFWLLGAVINRGRWGLWVVFGIIVGVIAYAGHILGQLFEAPFWNLTSSEGLELVGSQLLAPLAIAAFVFARELTIWFGAWVARIGARKTELNAEAQREYERTLEAGPTLAR